MVEYLPVGPKGAPQTIFGEKIISGLKSLTPYPSPLCMVALITTDFKESDWLLKNFHQSEIG